MITIYSVDTLWVQKEYNHQTCGSLIKSLLLIESVAWQKQPPCRNV